MLIGSSGTSRILGYLLKILRHLPTSRGHTQYKKPIAANKGEGVEGATTGANHSISN